MSQLVSEREQQRQALLLRIAQNRRAIGHTLNQLQRPILAVDRWQRGVRALLPILPGLLLAIAATLLVLLALRRREVRALTVVDAAAPRRNWLGVIQQLVATWRLALQLQAMLRAGLASMAAADSPSQNLSRTPEHVSRPD